MVREILVPDPEVGLAAVAPIRIGRLILADLKQKCPIGWGLGDAWVGLVALAFHLKLGGIGVAEQVVV